MLFSDPPMTVTKTYLPDRSKLDAYIDRIYATHHVTNYGPLVRELEVRLAAYLGVKHLILVANGTLALQLAYQALDLCGSVITTPFSFPATTSTLVWAGLDPIFADIDEGSWTMAVSNIEALIRPDTKAIVPVHVFGNACEVEAIKTVADRYQLKVIYDGAHAFGVTHKGVSLLNWGDISTVSFHATKLFHTVEGGALITSDDAVASHIRLLLNFGISGPGQVVQLGINAKMNEFEAAMGLAVLDDIETIKQAREQVWTIYHERLDRSVISFQVPNSDATQTYGYLPVLFPSEAHLVRVEQALNERGVFPRRYFYPSLHTLPYITHRSDMPISQAISQRILCLPMYVGLSLDQVRDICDIVNGGNRLS